jgi:hypothetical protein
MALSNQGIVIQATDHSRLAEFGQAIGQLDGLLIRKLVLVLFARTSNRRFDKESCYVDDMAGTTVG